MSKSTPTKRVIKKRLTKAEKAERAEFAEREARTRELLKRRFDTAIELRSRDREFHGLEREFRYHQEDMLRDFNRSKDMRHPRDVGMAREQILRRFLVDKGLIPGRYAATSSSVRVASTTGHMSNELDLLFYNDSDSICLMRREKAYSVLPVECTYGVIQVKSKVSRNDVRDGLRNIASYKKLRRAGSRPMFVISDEPKSQDGFGVLFAYDTDLDWGDLVDEIKSFARENPKQVWPNLVFILSKGLFLYGDDTRASFLNGAIANLDGDVVVHGRPDREGFGFYNFYSILIALLGNTLSQEVPVDSYFSLPLVAGDYSYKFSFGSFAEFQTCDQHGNYARKLTEEKLIKVIEWCKSAEPINWVRATDIACGKPGDNWEAYKRQNAEVRIYNPRGIPLSDLIMADTMVRYDGKDAVVKSIAYDSIETSGLIIWIPYIYEIEEGIINFCPKCGKLPVEQA
ncbi:DUF6602 domain-containing protein [Burkholderia multivorans]|uniref:DUF6602 domain-containing protein n=1 Tax=Burkholderia multivorans TaxID=87883 RepID=UPI00158CED17|nr:DUF6602 domain-containing protein [Burkholderia multivorans]MBU9309848.1 hypothetical protein [Burkholderia multivorans]MBU9576728.1 hypothetical protein [Burkholderia multivorans]MDN7951899.1 hypothetical protein [Burkholderia multivorans]MDN7965741.1 hypothetical protein [Burkholderia multivorans]MDR9241572.1 hypothetical protein [Burkholderia multivorans]